jgi:hypothetical protein
MSEREQEEHSIIHYPLLAPLGEKFHFEVSPRGLQWELLQMVVIPYVRSHPFHGSGNISSCRIVFLKHQNEENEFL